VARKHIVKIRKVASNQPVQQYEAICNGCDLNLFGVPAHEAERCSEQYHEIRGTKVDQYKMC
jgi:hypothetical protein